MRSPYLSLKAAAKYLDCDIALLKKQAESGKIPFMDCSKPGSKLKIRRFDKEDLDKAKDTF